MVPGRAGSDTHVDVHIALSQLRDLPGAPVLEDAWLAAKAGEHGYLAGRDAETIACDALIVPVVTGSPDWAVIGQMITLVQGAFTRPGPRPESVRSTVTAIAAAIINSFMITHSIIITVIVTVSVLAVTLSLGKRICRDRQKS